MTRLAVARPRYVTKITKAEADRGDGGQVTEFIEAFCHSTKDTVASGAGDRLELRPWQRHILDGLFARRPDGRRKHRVGLIGLPRKNGKSALGSGIALHGLFLAGAGAEVYSCAADQEQARIVFGVARRMIELEPELNAVAKLYRDAIEVKATGSVYRVLSSEAFTKEGLSPTLVVYDELHAAPTDELWNVMNLGSGARVDPLVVAITTAGVRSDQTGLDSTCYRLYQHGRRVVAGEVVDPSFYFCWYEAHSDADHRDPATWRKSNPGFGDLLDPEDFESAVAKTPEAEFRTKRCNQWVTTDLAWMPAGSFEAIQQGRTILPGAEICVGFDGSYSKDATALVMATVEEVPHMVTVGVWERPYDAEADWTIPTGEVVQAVEHLFDTFEVVRMYADPSWWPVQLDQWAERFGEDRVLKFPNTPQRMVPACATFYQAVIEKTFTHDADKTLVRHVRNATLKQAPNGTGAYISKIKSRLKIDAAVAAVMCLQAVNDAKARGSSEVTVMYI